MLFYILTKTIRCHKACFPQGLLFELPRMLHSTCFLCQCCHEFFLLSNHTCQLMGSLLAANWTNFDLLPTAFNHLALAPSQKKTPACHLFHHFIPQKISPPGSAEVAVGCRLFTSGSMISSYSNKPGAISFQGRALQEISRKQSCEEEFLHRKNMAWHVHSAFWKWPFSGGIPDSTFRLRTAK